MLQEQVGDHCQQRMPVQSAPRAALEVIQAEFFLELLMRLFADPACLDQARETLQRRIRR